METERQAVIAGTGRLIASFFLLLCAWTEAAAATADGMRELTGMALRQNPAVRAAWLQVQQVTAGKDELRGFFDPRVSAGGGVRSEATTGWDTALLLGGVQAALLPGAYFQVDAEQRRINGYSDADDRLWTTVLSAQLRIPLNRDRGFILWKLDWQRASAEERAALQQLATVCQALRQEVELEYLILQERLVAQVIAAAATVRVEKLLEQAEELVKLQSIPEYQLYPARLEVALRREEEKTYAQAVTLSRNRIAELLGGQPWKGAFIQPDAESLIRLAADATLPADTTVATAMRCRADVLRLREQTTAAEHRHARNREDLRSDLSVQLQADWLTDTTGTWLGNDHTLGERSLGGQALLVWSRPWNYRSERARLRQSQARLDELAENVLLLENQVRTEIDNAVSDFGSARDRLSLVAEAVASARQTLAAEEERFRLGEGRSRNVLDAQSDLTNAIRRQSAAAAELLRAATRCRHAMGYGGEVNVPAFDDTSRLVSVP